MNDVWVKGGSLAVMCINWFEASEQCECPRVGRAEDNFKMLVQRKEKGCVVKIKGKLVIMYLKMET